MRQALAAARTLLDPAWLTDQHRLEPNDPLLLHLKPVRSPRFQIHGIRYGTPEGMHPLAEAVLVADEVLKQYGRDGRFLGSTAFYLLMSIRDVVTYRDQIENVDLRLERLLSPTDWKPTLYELTTAAAYASLGTKPRILPESDRPSPDMELALEPRAYAECKARLYYEAEVIDFVSAWRRDALGFISDYLRRVDAGFIVRVAIHKHSAIRDVPAAVQAMVTAGERVRDSSEFAIEIDPIDSGTVTIHWT